MATQSHEEKMSSVAEVDVELKLLQQQSPFLSSKEQEADNQFIFSSGPSYVKETLACILLLYEKETAGSAEKPFTAVGPTHSSASEEKFIGSRKISGITKREYILRHKSIQLEKSYRTCGSKGLSVRNATLKISKEMGTCLPQDTLHNDLLNTNGLPPTFSLDTVNNTISSIPKTNFVSAIPTISDQNSLPAPDTELSLSLSSKNNSVPMPASCSSGAPNFGYSGFPNEKPAGQWVPEDKKDESIMKLAPRVRELQNRMQEWTEWADQKVMQAARRLSKDKAELKTLKQEKEEVERLKKEKQSLEENTMKKLCEMENALCKASGQLERANAAVRRLEETAGSAEKPFTAVGPTHSSASEEKFIGSRKISGITKREYILRHKSIQLEKSYRTCGSKAIPTISDQNSLPAPDTELSLSLSSKNNSVPMPASCSSGAPNFGYSGFPNEKPAGQWVPEDKKDESIMKLAPRVRELQNRMQEWTEWADQKVMQAARRLSKDKAELKTLKQEKEEVERLKKEKQSLEENTMKKLCEMENALCKASGQLERANAAVRRLEVENSTLRQEMEAAK
uniref:Uncharacterized protein n=1 Tax=Daucus carota subsp. sativus TaxID=79200 RepID=A0A164SRZ4_DAUCS